MKMKFRWCSLIFYIGLFVAFIPWLHSATFTIQMQNISFVPPNQTVSVGDTVTWMNSDPIQHTTTSGQVPSTDGIWNSGLLSGGQSFSHTFASSGSFPYFCQVHTTLMTGGITVQAGPNTSPTVTITSPTNNSIVSAGASVTIEATASATGGTVTQVEFFDGGNSLGVDTSSPYSVITNLTSGIHSLTAKATDSNNASSVSGVVTITVNGGGGTKIDDPIPQKIQKGDITIELQLAAEGLVSPVGMAVPDDGSGRLFVYDQIGLIQIISNGTNSGAPLLDVRNRLVPLIAGYDERGLIGLATHPNFAQHPYIYTYTSEPNGPTADFVIVPDSGRTNNCQSVIAEWHIDPGNTNSVDPASRREILRIDKPESNHNGGTLRFGSDGFLYFAIGDGGQADDQGPGHSPGGNAQDKSKILGKMSRIDIDARTSPNGQYGIPLENPFIGQAGIVQEIYAFGLRNPYSFSFDRQTGEIFLGDVGQNDVEEVDNIVKGGNYGWPIKEGSFFFDPNGTSNGFVTTLPVRDVPSDLIDPIANYDHDEGDAVIGGYLYRGSAVSSLSGKYVTGDLGELDKPSFGRLFFLEGSQVKELRIGSDDRPLGMFLKGFGEDRNGELYVFGSTNVGPSGTAGKMFKIVASSTVILPNRYAQSNLVSDISGLARFTDTNLANPWGIAISPSSPFWISDNHTGLSTLYNSTGAVQSLVVTIPPPTGGQPPAAPTGIIFNNTTNFNVSPGTPARFVFATEDGTIIAWNTGTNAVLKSDQSASGAIFKGLAQGTSGASNFLFAANFHAGTIDVFDSDFQAVTSSNSFTDPTIPAGFAPFNIRPFGGNLFVTYAKQDDEKEDDVGGPGNGYINVFDMSGNLLKRFASNGTLNSPWGLAMAPSGFGQFAGALLVGNFGDGRINAFDPVSGAFLGQLNDTTGNPIAIQGLWDLIFGNGAQGGDTDKLYFTAGIAGDGAIEDHGLFGRLSFISSFVLNVTRNENNLTIHWTGATGPFILQKKTNLLDATWTDVETLSETSATVTIEGASAFFRVSSQGTAP
ncbi:MAG: hypothetical protein JWM99_4815 [Verrucomicrobiales bacterium]|nr:hypothetical protein [Verrucomicrobiales bacterium]